MGSAVDLRKLKRALLIFSIVAMALVSFSLFSFIQMIEMERQITEGEKEHYLSYLLADELRQSSDDLSRMAHLYSVTGEERYREYFRRILAIRDGTAPRPLHHHGTYWDFVLGSDNPHDSLGPPRSLRKVMREAGIIESELALLEEGERESNELTLLENKVMDTVEQQQGRGARQMLYGDEYNRAKATIMGPIETFFRAIEDRVQGELSSLRQRQGRWNMALQATIGLVFVLMLVSSILAWRSPLGQREGRRYGVFSWLFPSVTLLVFLSIVVSDQFIESERHIAMAEERRYQSYLLADELKQSSDDLTRMARSFVVTGHEHYREYFNDILAIRNGAIPRPSDYGGVYWDFVLATGEGQGPLGEPVALETLMRRAGFRESELALLGEGEDKSNELVHLENRAMNQRPRETAEAIDLLHGKEYHQLKWAIMGPIGEVFRAVDKRTADTLRSHRNWQEKLGLILGVCLGSSFLFLLIMCLVLFPSSKGGGKRPT